MKTNGINIINAGILASDAGLSTSGRHVLTTSAAVRHELDSLLQLTVRRGQSSQVELIGSVQGGNPVLFAINECYFPFGATLSGNMLLFNGKKQETALTSLMTALSTTTGVSAVMCTQQPTASNDTSCWLALRTVGVVNDPRQLDSSDATFISQFAF